MDERAKLEEKKPEEKLNMSDSDLERLFHGAGLKMTNQRVAVYREVVEHASHPSAEAVYGRVRRRLPAISLNTVYRTLALLAEKGIIRHLEGLADKSFYDHNTDRHHHFICTRCGAIQDVHIDNLDMLRVEDMPEGVEEIVVHIKGLCDGCRGMCGAKFPEENAPGS